MGKALGLGATADVHVEVMHQIGGSDLDWAVGAALMLSLEVAEERVAKQKQSEVTSWIGDRMLGLLASIIVSVSILGCIWRHCDKKSSSRNWLDAKEKESD